MACVFLIYIMVMSLNLILNVDINIAMKFYKTDPLVYIHLHVDENLVSKIT